MNLWLSLLIRKPLLTLMMTVIACNQPIRRQRRITAERLDVSRSHSRYPVKKSA